MRSYDYNRRVGRPGLDVQQPWFENIDLFGTTLQVVYHLFNKEADTMKDLVPSGQGECLRS